MNPKQFLIIGGAVLVLVGVLGFANILGPSAGTSIFGENWWFDYAENIAHLVLGVVALVAAFTLGDNIQGMITMLVGVLGIAVTLWGFFNANLLGANLENPLDNILHLVVGVWALWAWRNASHAPVPPVGMMQ